MRKLSKDEMKKVDGGRLCQVLSYKNYYTAWNRSCNRSRDHRTDYIAAQTYSAKYDRWTVGWYTCQ